LQEFARNPFISRDWGEAGFEPVDLLIKSITYRDIGKKLAKSNVGGKWTNARSASDAALGPLERPC
jgi:hypothetical protein